MKNAQFERESIESQLLRLVDMIRLSIRSWDSSQIETFIRVGEFELAADEMAHEYFATGTTVPEDAMRLFVSLADEMNMLADPAWDGIQRIVLHN
jgi:hypothetical protein